MEESTENESAQLEFCRLLKWNPTWSSTIISTVVTGIASPLAILLNAILIIAVVKKKKLQSYCNTVLASMAVGDFLTGAVTQPLFLTAGIYRLQDDYESMCTVVLAGFFALHLISASIYHLTVVSWERYTAVSKGINYRSTVAKTRLKLCIFAAWVFTGLSVVPNALHVAGYLDRKQNIIAQACLFTTPLTVCLLATAYFYIRLYLKCREGTHQAIKHVSVEVARANLGKKIAKTGFLLTVALLASFAPIVILLFLSYLFGLSNRDTYLWGVILSQLNSSASPILYFYRNRLSRNTVLQMLNIGTPRNGIVPKVGPHNGVVPKAGPHNGVVPKAGPHNGVVPKAVPHKRVVPKAEKKEKPSNENEAKESGKAIQKDSGPAKDNSGTTATEKNNGKQEKSNSWGPVMFTEMQQALSQRTRPKTAPIRPGNGGTPKKENGSVNQTRRCLVTVKGEGHTTACSTTTRTGLLSLHLPHHKENGEMRACSHNHDSRCAQAERKGERFLEMGTSYRSPEYPESITHEMKPQRSSILSLPPIEVHEQHKDENSHQCRP